MQAFEVRELIRRTPGAQHVYEEFLRSDLLSAGLARWPAGSVDDQQPHTEDEVYYVVAGRARLQVADDDREVGPGSIVFVATGVDHHFHDITEDLDVIVFWAPPRHSRRQHPRFAS